MTAQLNTEERAPYLVAPTSTADDDAVIAKALQILEGRMLKPEATFTDVRDAKKFLKLKIGGNKTESFFVMFLDASNSLIAMEEMFKGTVDQVSVPIREIVRAVIKHDALSVVLAHNHPSGRVYPSEPDLRMTAQCQRALETINVDLVDHIIVSANEAFSFRENGIFN